MIRCHKCGSKKLIVRFNGTNHVVATYDEEDFTNCTTVGTHYFLKSIECLSCGTKEFFSDDGGGGAYLGEVKDFEEVKGKITEILEDSRSRRVEGDKDGRTD